MQNDKKQKSRATTKPSKELLHLLEMDRIVSVEIVVPDMQDHVRATMIHNQSQIMEFIRTREIEGNQVNAEVLWDKARQATYEWAWELIVDMSVQAGFQKLISHILKELPSESGFGKIDWVEAYIDFVFTRRTLFRIVRSTNDLENVGIVRSFEHIDQDKPITLTVTQILTDDGLIDFLNNPIVEALRKIPATRLRFCPVCNHIFWAYRLDQIRCSKKCANVHFQRQRRSDPKKRNNINEKRRENYVHKTANQKDGEK